ncbi:MAG: diacylglycerol kinase family protein [Bacteroidetes bacterium]|nr:diacylglycerol kinase family protein [Bacteroidota bacterium]
MSRLVKSFTYAWKGIYFYVTSKGNVRIHLFATLCVIGLGCWLHISLKQWIVLVLAIGMVHAAEAFNTAIEEIVNFISPQRHPSAGKIKDLAAGAVLITAVTAAIIGVLIFAPLLVQKFS